MGAEGRPTEGRGAESGIRALKWAACCGKITSYHGAGGETILKRTAAILLCICLTAGLLTGCGDIEPPFFHHGGGDETHTPEAGTLPPAELTLSSSEASENVLRAAVLYDGTAGTRSWEDLYSRLSQPLLLNFTAEAVDISGEFSLEGYDLLYPDVSVISSAGAEGVREAVVDFVSAGGGVFLTNDFYGFFEEDFLGAEDVRELADFPREAEYPDAGEDLSEMQEILRSYIGLLGEYAEAGALRLGYGLEPSTAVPLAVYDGLALAAVNVYGEGYVCFASALLPGDYSLSGTSLVQRGGSGELNDTDLGAERLFECAFAAFVAKRTQGYALWRVYGPFGAAAMSWQAALEDSSSISARSAQEFAELCLDYGQAPSYSLARSVYTRGLRAESVSTLLSRDGSLLSLGMDLYEDSYCAGTHVVSEGAWLTLAEFPDSGGYLEPSGLGAGAYPCAADLDGDGKTDLLVGSADGKLRVFYGEGYDGRLIVGGAEVLTSPDGGELSVPGAAAPLLADVDGDGAADILCGASDGCIYLFRGLAEGGFGGRELFCETDIDGRVLPELADLDGDGAADLILGSDCGTLSVVYGSGGGFDAEPVEISVFGFEGDWLAPRAHDMNGDGLTDLALGTAEGYVAILVSDGQGGFSSAGCIELDEQNADGNYHAKFGENCAPYFADLDGDGHDDLICGSLEYGMAYPIDSGYFSGRGELLEQLGAITGSGYYLGLHFYAGFGPSAERESYELGAHLEAMRSYGLAYGELGAGLHGLPSQSGEPAQTFLSLWDGGMLWCAGLGGEFTENGAGDVLNLPFYLTRGGERTILLFDNSGVLENDAWAETAGSLGLPLLLSAELWEGGLPEKVAAAEEIRREYGYSFVMEDQLMYSIAAAANLRVDVMSNSSSRFDLELVGTGVTNTQALYSGEYQTACGVRLSLGEALGGLELEVDADVWRREGNELYLGLNRPVRVYEAEGGSAPEAHITRVNLPATVSVHAGGASVIFTEGGMMEVETSAPAGTESSGWTARESGRGGTVFTRYSAEPGSIIITYD